MNLFYLNVRVGRKKRREGFHPMVYTPNHCNSQESRALISHVGAGVRGLGPSSAAFLGHQQGAELKVELPGLELIPTRNISTTGKISPLYHHAGTKILLFSEYTAFEPEFRL